MTVQDNINWKRVFGDLSVTGTMVNWTVLVHRQPNEDKMRNDGCFYNDNHVNERLDRKGKDWDRDFLQNRQSDEDILKLFCPDDESIACCLPGGAKFGTSVQRNAAEKAVQVQVRVSKD